MSYSKATWVQSPFLPWSPRERFARDLSGPTVVLIPIAPGLRDEELYSHLGAGGPSSQLENYLGVTLSH
jgi:hypothetical protein